MMYNFSILEGFSHSGTTEVLNEDETVSTSWTIPFILLATITILMKVNDAQQNTLRHIPGPWILPLIGTLHKIGLNPHKAFKTLGEKYGDVFKIKIGNKEVVVVRGLETIREALQKTDNFSSRPFLYTFQYLSGGKSLSFSAYDQDFRRHKQLAEWSLGRYIAEADAVNTVVQYEAQELTKHFLSLQGKAVDPSEPVLWAVGHVLYNMFFGNSRDEKQDFEFLINGTIDLIDMHNSGNIVNFVPLARKVLHWKVKEIQDTCHKMCNISSNKEQEQLTTFQSGIHRNTLDFLIEASLKNKDKIGQTKLLHTCQDFLGAGLDIVQVALTWAILYLAEYEEIQNRLKHEIKSNLGENQLPRKEDAVKLPFMQAFILEVLRHSSLVPFALPHAPTKDSNLQGFMIPEGTFVLIDMYSIHSSVDLWGDPENFRPDRFLNTDGLLDHRTVDLFIPFGAGRRKCLGQVFAKQEMLMFLSVLLQQCCIQKPKDTKQYNLKCDFGLILRPKPFKVEFYCD